LFGTQPLLFPFSYSVNALTALDKVALGMEDGYVRTFTDQLVPMAELLAKYINLHKSAGTDVCYDYAKSLLRLVRENVRIFRAGLPADQDIPLRPDLGISQLSVKEYRVLRLLAAGRSNLEIAAELCLSLRTVKYYNTQIFGKLGVNNRMEAVKRA
jgi:LuxR family transcriptional regulator, maltose regulon positive regulatory protein